MFANKKHEEAHQLLKNGKIEEAILYYTKALEEAPSEINIISDRGVAYLHLKDKENCFKDLNKAIEMQPNYAFRYACRAFAKNNFGDIDGAIEDYKKAIELDPDDAVAHNNLGLLFEQKGYIDEAKKRFERADKLSKQEDHLLHLVDDLENQSKYEAPTAEEKPQAHHEIDPSIQREENIKVWDEMKKVLTTKKGFKEFLEYVRNGFKIK